MKQSAVLFVTGEFFVELCKPGKPRMLTVDRGLPNDAELVNVMPCRYGFSLEISSALFPSAGAQIDVESGLPIIESPIFTVVYEEPKPRCASCQHWEDGAPMEFVQGEKPSGRWGYCHLIATKDYDPVNPNTLAFVDTESAGEHAQPLYVHENFGCVQFTAKPDPAQ